GARRGVRGRRRRPRTAPGARDRRGGPPAGSRRRHRRRHHRRGVRRLRGHRPDRGDPMTSTAAAPSNWNVPNVLTVLRIVLVPVFLVVLFVEPHDQGWRLAATAIFTVAILTDLADGHIARKH